MPEIANRYKRLYAIGDIHGRLDLLDEMVRKIDRDLEDHRAGECLTVTLGDYVDRGPDSRRVLERLSGNPFATDYVGLKGNHEELLQSFLDARSPAKHWLQLGGAATARSYGMEIEGLADGDLAKIGKRLRAAIPAEHFRFLASLRTSLTVGKYFFCHAGVRPGVALDRQRDEDLLWIRNEFLKSTADFGKIVVHGHTPTDYPEVLPNRINIDTGAFMTGRLTCLVLELETGTQRFLSALGTKPHDLRS